MQLSLFVPLARTRGSTTARDGMRSLYRGAQAIHDTAARTVRHASLGTGGGVAGAVSAARGWLHHGAVCTELGIAIAMQMGGWEVGKGDRDGDRP